MNAYALYKRYRTDWNSQASADDILLNGSRNFASLPWDARSDDIELEWQNAVYLYGGRSALVRAIQAMPKDPANYRIGSRENVILLRGTLKVGGGKTKQMLVIRTKPKAGVAGLRQNLVQVNGADENQWISLSTLEAIINALPKR